VIGTKITFTQFSGTEDIFAVTREFLQEFVRDCFSWVTFRCRLWRLRPNGFRVDFNWRFSGIQTMRPQTVLGAHFAQEEN
jgi:hypothetical protein